LPFLSSRPYAARTQRASSLRLGRLPVISIPTLYILAAIHVTTTVPTTRSASELVTSTHVRFPAAHRAGVAIGDVKGTSDSATDRCDSGFASVAKELKNAIMMSTVTGAWL
jgi:hypothetical protein